MKLLLDSHVLLWAVYEPERLSSSAHDSVSDVSNELFVSLASVWELANKAAAYKLPLAGSSVERMMQRIEDLGVEFIPISREDIGSAAVLPRHHSDPFDRMLIAQAQRYGLLLVTKDPLVATYAVSVLW